MKKKILFAIFICLFIFGFNISIYAAGDVTLPVGTILINNEAHYTNTRNVILTLSASEGVIEMKFNNGTGIYSDPEPYSTTKAWTLSQSGDGLKTVRVKFIDPTGETATGIAATITLDTVAPVITLNGDATINLNIGDIYMEAGATASDNIDGDITSLIVKGGMYVDTSVAETYTVTYDVKDQAGNSATQVVRTINVTEKDTGIGTGSSSETSNENVVIRNGDTVIYNGAISLPNSGTINIEGHDIDAKSVLGVLYTLDQKENSFSISDLSYNDSFKSFLLNCITPLSSSPLCYNWNYVVDGTYSNVGMDKNIIDGNNNIYLFFGQPNQVLLSANSINSSENLTVTAQKYNYEDNTWTPRTEVTVGIVQINPSDPYNPTEIQTGLVDVNSQITFSSIPVGTYGVGVKDDYYWPQENFEVTNITSGSSGGGSSTTPVKTFSVSKALSFLSSQQKGDGSFGDPLYTDWAAIAATAGDNSTLKSKIYNYLKNNPLDFSIITDNERHAMALMALGINPYSGTDINYIKKITDSFDGTQIGDSSLDNDDIFALIVLANAGYSSSDEIISEDVKYLLNSSKQPSNGFWGSIDMTSAVIQALRRFEDIAGVSDVISRAENYLISNQESDNGFGNSFSTSWVLQSLFNNNQILKAENYLVLKQQTDGGMENINDDMDTRVWSTSYAIPAILHKPWKNIMQSFSKPVTQNNSSVSVSENTDSQTSNNPVVCPRGDLFSTITGQACTTTDETNIITINTPINNQNPDLVKKIEDKKIIEVPKIKNIIKSDPLKISESSTSEISVENNLGASVENTTPIEISVKKISQIVINSVINILTYIGKGFYDLIIFFQSQIGVVFR